jgi:hypothetical protein
MRCFQGFRQNLAGFTPENTLFSSYLQVNAVMMTSTTVEQLPAAAIYPSWQVSHGGLATVFPSTAAVESDHYIIKWEKNEPRKVGTEFSLKGILHSKQYKAVLTQNTE